MSPQFQLEAMLASAITVSGVLIVDAAIKGTFLLAIAAVVAWGFQRDSAATRHWVWLVGIISLLLMP